MAIRPAWDPVILSEAKNPPARATEILRFAQNDDIPGHTLKYTTPYYSIENRDMLVAPMPAGTERDHSAKGHA